MKRVNHPLLSLAAPFLICLAIIGFFSREGSARLQTIPTLVVGTGLVVSAAIDRRLKRNKLLLAIRKSPHEGQ